MKKNSNFFTFISLSFFVLIIIILNSCDYQPSGVNIYNKDTTCITFIYSPKDNDTVYLSKDNPNFIISEQYLANYNIMIYDNKYYLDATEITDFGFKSDSIVNNIDYCKITNIYDKLSKNKPQLLTYLNIYCYNDQINNNVHKKNYYISWTVIRTD